MFSDVYAYEGDPDGDSSARHIYWFLVTFFLVIVVVTGASLLIALSVIATAPREPRWVGWMHACGYVGTSLLVGCTGFAGGSMLGFLFGIPRVKTLTGAADTGDGLDSNTNLEQVSDWLTKIVVGVGLTQIYSANGLLQDFSYTIDTALHTRGAGFAACLILIGASIAGFVAAYLKSRTALMAAFTDSAGKVKNALGNLAQDLMFASGATSLKNGGAPVDDTARQVASRVLITTPPTTKNPRMLKAIGLANAALGNYTAAADALKSAQQNGSADQDVTLLLPYALALAGRTSEVEDEASLPPSGTPLGDAVYRDNRRAMFVALYDPHAGYERAMKIGQRLAEEARGDTDPRLWLYLSSAYGQKYTADATNPSGQADDLSALKLKTLDAVKKAIKLGGDVNRQILRMNWTPDLPGKPQSENDLEIFFTDPDFQAIFNTD